MSDFPYIQFFPADWLSDPRLSMCSPSTRGIWMDAVCAMHASGRAGELTGTTDQLARACRCLPAEMCDAIADLKTTGAATITERNGFVTLVNRRMKREAGKRKLNLERQKKHRNGGVTPESPPLSRDGHANVTDTRASEPEVRGQRTEEEAEASSISKTRGSAGELKAYCVERGLMAEDGEWLFDKMLASGWKNDGHRVEDWRGLVRAWQKIQVFPSQKNQPNPHNPNGSHRNPTSDRNAAIVGGGRAEQYAHVGRIGPDPT